MPAPCTCSIIIKSDLLRSVGGFEESFIKVFTDQCLYAKIFLNARAYVSSSVWDRYRQHPNSSCQVAERRGEIATTRIVFLDWLQRHLRERDKGGSLERSLRYERYRARLSLLARKAKRIPLVRGLARMRRRWDRDRAVDKR
jgi:hypothetical protein